MLILKCLLIFQEAAAINAMVVTPTTSQCRFDWFQMSGNITLSVYAKNIIPESADVRCNGVFLNVSFVYDGGKALFERGFNLYGVSYRKFTLLIYNRNSGSKTYYFKWKFYASIECKNLVV